MATHALITRRTLAATPVAALPGALKLSTGSRAAQWPHVIATTPTPRTDPASSHSAAFCFSMKPTRNLAEEVQEGTSKPSVVEVDRAVWTLHLRRLFLVWIAGERHPTGHLPVSQPAPSGALLFWAGSGMAGRQRRLSPAALGA